MPKPKNSSHGPCTLTRDQSIQAGDTAVAKALDRTAHWLGIGMANVVHLFNPEAIVLGGGVMERFGQRIRETARKSMEAHLMPLDRTGGE